MRERILAPSILSADFANLGSDIQRAANAGAKYLHIDVMDGLFVPRISFGMPIIQSIRRLTNITFDVHLMIVEPERYLAVFREMGADSLTVHIETLSSPETTLKTIRGLGAKVGISLNPETPVEKIFPYLDLVDLVLCQDVGSKAHCIQTLKAKGYGADKILMVGDAPGDKAAAEINGVYYYPILVRHEKESWEEFPYAANLLKEGTYAPYGTEKALEFLANLSGNSQRS